MAQYNTSPDLASVLKDIKVRLATLENATNGGSRDTGWLPIALSGSNTKNLTYSSFTPAARLVGDRLYFCGAVNLVSTAFAGTLPASFPELGIASMASGGVVAGIEQTFLCFLNGNQISQNVGVDLAGQLQRLTVH